MRIGIDIRELEQGKQTGIGRYLANLLSAPCLRRSHHEWVLFGNQKTRPPGDFTFVRVAERSKVIWDHVLLPGAVRRHRIQLFFSPYRKAPLMLSCPFVVTIHDLLPLGLPGYRTVRNLPLWMFLWLTAHRALRIITVSQFVKQEIVQRLRVPPEKVVVIYHGVAPQFRPVDPKASGEQLARTFGVEGDYLLYVGQLRSHKNVDKLICAYGKLPPSSRLRCHLLIAGNGPSRQSLEALVSQRGLTGSVRFLGVVDDELLPLLYSQATACVLPSSHEGFGLPVIEAMACGCPVLAARRTALPEVIADAGLLVDPDEQASVAGALGRLLSDPVLRQQLRAQGLARVQAFSLDRAVAQVLAVFDEIEQERA